MKKIHSRAFWIASLVLSLSIFSRCQNEGGAAPKIPQRDTVPTLGAYMGYQLKNVHWGLCFRVTVDSLAWVQKDSTSQTKKWTKIHYYIATVPVRVDSSFSANFHVPMLDSVGKPRNEQVTIVLDEKYVRDGITNLDSAVAELKRLYLVDTAIVKK